MGLAQVGLLAQRTDLREELADLKNSAYRFWL